jgi:hypothetical protein
MVTEIPISEHPTRLVLEEDPVTEKAVNPANLA